MQITSSSSFLVIIDSGRTYTYQKRTISLVMNDQIVIKALGKTAHTITDYTSVTTPSSSSLDDLFNKINALINS